MSDSAHCDVCLKVGRRRNSKHCPDGWFYGEFIERDDMTRGAYVVSVCSKECATAFFLPGPGDLKTSPPYVVHHKANRDISESDGEWLEPTP